MALLRRHDGAAHAHRAAADDRHLLDDGCSRSSRCSLCWMPKWGFTEHTDSQGLSVVRTVPWHLLHHRQGVMSRPGHSWSRVP